MTFDAPLLARAPGRVNLIGDHTDYTGGFCFPIAIDRWVEVAGLPTSGSTVRLRSESTGTTVEFDRHAVDVATVEPAWGRYVAAVARRLAGTRGFAGTIRSTLPMGSGLSSSAALEVACALAIGAAGGDGVDTELDGLALARLCRDAEHEARGVPTGLLDQLASIFGVEHHALLIDCHLDSITPVPLPSPDELTIVVIDSGTRSLADSGYAARVAECAAVEADIGPLRTATMSDVDGLGDPVLRRRARHVVTENARVHAFAAAVMVGDLASAGAIMNESHASLRDDYQSSTDGIDELCARLVGAPGVFGARITGGGWGGCVVAIARPVAVERIGWLGGKGMVVRASAGAALR